MKHQKPKIKIDETCFTTNYIDYIVREKFVADGVRWIRCTDPKLENKCFTEREVFKILQEQ